MINSWRKILAKTDIGKGGTHDKYINIPKVKKIKGIKYSPYTGSDESPTQFYNTKPGLPQTATDPPSKSNWKFIEHIDKKTGAIYNARYEWAHKSNQTRLYKLAECYNARNAQEGDEFVVEKILVDGKFFFTVDIVRNGLSIDVLSRQEIERSSNIKNKIRKKPETNIFLDKINESSSQLEKHRTGKARKLNDIIREAEIYKVTFTIENKTFVYVGQDSYCSGKHYYFGSSILTDFCKLVYGDKIFEKTILQSFQNIKQKNLNIKEWESIYNARSECKKNGWHNINREVQK